MTLDRGTQGTVSPRAAATLVVVRDSAGGPEVLLTIRPEHLRFMGGAAVFPGGAIADADRHPDWQGACDVDAAAAGDALGDSPVDALAAYVCAIRESYEEVGLLPADGPARDVARPLADDPESFRRACVSNGVKLRASELVPAGRWVTPLGAPVRFDTRFFVVRAPDGWEPDPDPSEVAAVHWVTPAAALEGLTDGRFLMAPPTIETLQRLAGHDDVGALLSALRASLAGAAAERLSPLVQRVVAPNPGLMTGPGTNSYIVGLGPSYIVDPGDADPAYLQRLVDSAIDLAGVLVTHRHSDHVGGIRALTELRDVPVRAFGSEPAGGVDVEPIHDEEVIDLGVARLIALHTPGHARDHLVFYLEGAASLFAGDNVLGRGTAVIAPPDGNMREYLGSLRRMRERHTSRIYPGHFDPLDGGDHVIDGYLQHRAERQAAILEVISKRPATIEEIVDVVYVDTPAVLHQIAGLQVQAVLEMLLEDRSVSVAGNRWSASNVG